MKIRHRDYGDVDDVIGIATDGPDFKFIEWERRENGRIIRFLRAHGWSEVKEPRYVDVTDLAAVSNDGRLWLPGWGIVNITDKWVFRRQHWFDMPENLLHEIHYMTAKGFIEYIQCFKKPCLIVEKEEG